MPRTQDERVHVLQARKLFKTYGKGETAVPVLKGVNLDVPRGQFVSIMGPSGSGKSTLLNMIGLLDEPTGGGVRIAGRTARGLTGAQRAKMRRETLGFIFQSFHLMPRTSALGNVMLPMALAGVPARVRRKRAMQLLHAVGLSHRLRNKPSELSGGEKQRVAVARSLALDPPILLADEPTGNLDSKNSEDIMRLFQRLHASGRTIVQVTHAREMAMFGERIIHFRDGIIERDERIAPEDRA